MRSRWRRLAKINRSIVSATCPATPVRTMGVEEGKIVGTWINNGKAAGDFDLVMMKK